MKCEFCTLVQDKRGILYIDNEIVVAVKENGMNPGQVTVFPKEHYTILEMIPDKILEKCVVMSNKVGIAVFEGSGCQGTNLLVRNGLGAGQTIPHFSLEIIPRWENDELTLQWQPLKLLEEEMEVAYNTITEKKEPAVKETPSAEEEQEKEQEQEQKKENYLIKSQRRRP